MTPSLLHSGRRVSPRRILLFGVEGWGKSEWASESDRPVFISTEDGLDDIDCHSFDAFDSYQQVIGHLGWLYTESHDFATVVIDSLDWLERLIWKAVCVDEKVENIADIGYGKGYDYAISYWQEVIDGLTALRKQRGMTTILIAHAKVEKFANPEGDSYDRYQPRLHKTASHLIREWCSEILFANYKVYTTTTDEGFGRKKAHGAGNGDRVLYTAERPAHVAKNRLSLPYELPFQRHQGWSEFSKYLPQEK